jgi:hypothetical protein
MHFVPPAEYKAMLEQAGFSVDVKDVSPLYLSDILSEYRELLHTSKGEEIKQTLGEEAYRETIESWQSHMAIRETGELSMYLFTGTKTTKNEF